MLERRVPYHDDAVPFVLLWSQKAGCTSLLTWFLHHADHLDEAVEYGAWVHDWERKVMRQQPGYLDRLHERIVEGVAVYKLVRDPFDRAVSSYLSLLEIPDGDEHDTLPLRCEIRQMVYGTGDVDYSFSFRQFLRWLATKDIDAIDGHLAAQSTPLDDAIDDLVYIRLESIDAELRAIEERHGLTHAALASLVPPPHHVARSPRRFADRSAIADLQPPIPLADGPALPRAADFLAPDAVAAITDIYARDVEHFGTRPLDGTPPADGVPASDGVPARESPGSATATTNSEGGGS